MKSKTGFFLLLSGMSAVVFSDNSTTEIFIPSDTPASGHNIYQTVRLAESPEVILNRHIVQLAQGTDLDTIKTLSVPLGNGINVDFHGVRTELTSSGSRVWEGQQLTGGVSTSEPAMNYAVLVERKGRITGTVRYEGKLYKITPLEQGQHVIAKIDESKALPAHPENFAKIIEESLRSRLLASQKNRSGFRAPGAIPVIRVMVPFTPYAKSATADIYALIDLAIAETNSGLRNSNIQAKLELAHAFEVPKPDSTSELVKNARDQYQADIVVFLQDLSSAGFAFGIGVNEDKAFARVNVHYATGSSVFGHEIGHLIGALHDPVTEINGDNYPFPYGHGYINPDFKWRTIMSYGGPCNYCPRLNYWSSPEQTYQGDAMGEENVSDTARVWSERAFTVASFRGGADGTNHNSVPEAVITTTPEGKQITGAGTIELSGMKSNDADGDPLSYRWQQIAPLTPKATIVFPFSIATNVTFDETQVETTYRFQLTVADKESSSSAEVSILQRPKSAEGSSDAKQCSQTDPAAKNLPLWNETTAYSTGNRVNYEDLVWEAKWWIKGEQPDSSTAWLLISDVLLAWEQGKSYVQGDQVIFDNRIFEAKQWTSASPANSPNLWVDRGPYDCKL